jgi:hypothetical protein
MGDFTTAGEVESVTAHEVINMIMALAQIYQCEYEEFFRE